MAEAGKDQEYTSMPISWYQRDVLLFANSIGCTVDELHFLYELHPNFSVFPTYPIILPFKGTSPEVIDFYAASQRKTPSSGSSETKLPPLDPRRVVDGERSIQFLKPLPPTSANHSFSIRTKVLGVYDKGKPGTVVETQQELIDDTTSEIYTRAIGSAFYVGQGGWAGPKGPKTISYPPPSPPKEPDYVYEHPTTPESAHLYRLNGDYNPLHATPEPGQKMGFGGAIMHGLYSWNTTCHALLKTLGGSDPANIREFAARFASPVRPGDVLVTEIWRLEDDGKDKDGFEEVRFVTSVKGGKVCLSNGRARISVVTGAGGGGEKRIGSKL